MTVGTQNDAYAVQFERFADAPSLNGHRWLHQLRGGAFQRFKTVGFPTVRDEEWKYTNVAPLVKIPFAASTAADMPLDAFRALPYGYWTALRLVFVNGHFAAHLSSLDGLPAGVQVMSLAEALKREPATLEPLLTRRSTEQVGAFVALNSALFEDGAYLRVSSGIEVGQPIHLLYLATKTDEPFVCYPRNLVVAEANSRVTVMETYHGPDEATYFTNAVTDVFAMQNAAVEHYKVQLEGRAAFHVASTEFHPERDSRFTSCFISYGGSLVRNDIDAIMDAEGVSTTLDGLYITSGTQHVDNDTLIDHRKPHCQCHENYKGILSDSSQGVFSGTICVRPDAQKSDAHQYNKNLLLSEKAVVDTRPQLQIQADDVKCTHGVAVGALSDDELFYLRSRGIGEEEARNLLIYAFASEIIDKVSIDTVRHDLRHMLVTGGPDEE